MPRAALIAAVAFLAAAAPAPAAQRWLRGLHDARYCEIFELRGTPPDAAVTVWNSIGLNTCPAPWWHGFDPATLARQRGDTAVILNGPRHFLMDAVSDRARLPVRRFHGRRMRRVASIPIHTAADLARTPYTDRTIDRDNTWRWRAGRRVYELVAPGGDVYVMQAYAQIVDPSLTLGKLRSLGRRLALPPGWRYRTRVLRHPLSLDARGGHATILQDELQDTYQLARATRHGPRRRHALRLRGRTHAVVAPAPGMVEDRGTVRGTPFGRGRVVLDGTLAGGKLTGTFRLTFPRGSVVGTVEAPFAVAAGTISFAGTATLTGGTGAYRGIRGDRLTLHDRNTLDGHHGRLRVRGRVRY